MAVLCWFVILLIVLVIACLSTNFYNLLLVNGCFVLFIVVFGSLGFGWVGVMLV